MPGAAAAVRTLEDGRQLSYKKTSKSTGLAASVSYFDATNRVLLTGKEGFRGRLIYSQTQYDERGRVSWTSLPYS